MDKDFMLNYFNKAVQPEWEELLKTPRYQPAASKRDAIEREFFRMLNDEQKRKYLDLESAVILAECDIAEAMYMKGAADRFASPRHCSMIAASGSSPPMPGHCTASCLTA